MTPGHRVAVTVWLWLVTAGIGLRVTQVSECQAEPGLPLPGRARAAAPGRDNRYGHRDRHGALSLRCSGLSERHRAWAVTVTGCLDSDSADPTRRLPVPVDRGPGPSPGRDAGRQARAAPPAPRPGSRVCAGRPGRRTGPRPP